MIFAIPIRIDSNVVLNVVAISVVGCTHFIVTSTWGDEVGTLIQELGGFVRELPALVEGFAELACPAAQEVIGLLWHVIHFLRDSLSLEGD